VTRAPTAMSRILYLSHDPDQPRGGVNVLYDHVFTLRQHGFDAFVVHATPSYRYRFAQYPVPVIDASTDFRVLKTDTLVVPEDYAAAIRRCRNLSCRKVLFCQGHYCIFDGLEPGEKWSDFGFSTYLCTSILMRQVMKRWFGVDASVVSPCVDTAFYSDEPKPLGPPFTVATMPRKGRRQLRFVQGLLAADGSGTSEALSWVEISGMPQEDVATRLRNAHIYVATGVNEGLGLPPLEAMAAGCLVVGFAGGGGAEYATAENGVWVPDEDVWALAEALEQTISALSNPAAAGLLQARRMAGHATAQKYTRRRFEHELTAFWSGL